jgi:hypothetical protein
MLASVRPSKDLTAMKRAGLGASEENFSKQQ